jgi:hypothetical protein
MIKHRKFHSRYIGDDFLEYFGEYKKIIRELGTEVETLYGAHRRLDRLVLVDDDTLQNWEFHFKPIDGDELRKFYEYNNIKFDNIISFDGSYVLRFTANVVTDGFDLINEFYDEIAAEKSRTHAPRDNAPTVSLESAIEAQNAEDYDVDEAEKLMKELDDERK